MLEVEYANRISTRKGLDPLFEVLCGERGVDVTLGKLSGQTRVTHRLKSIRVCLSRVWENAETTLLFGCWGWSRPGGAARDGRVDGTKGSG